MPDQPAIFAADELMRRLIDKQPQLFTPKVPSGGSGTDVAEFVKALRDGLIQMYEQTPAN
jgi:hypothetical protein